MVEKLIGDILALPRYSKRALTLALDVALCVVTVWLAFYLRLNTFVSLAGTPSIAVAVSVLVSIPIFIVSGFYRAVLRYSGADVVWSIIQATTVYGLIYAAVFTAYSIEGVPRTVGIIQPILLGTSVAFSRVGASYVLGGRYRRLLQSGPVQNCLIYGAGLSGQQLAAAIKDAGTMRVVGFVDDDASMAERLVASLKVWSPENLSNLIAKHSITSVLLAIPSATRQRRNEIIERLREENVEVRTLPGVVDMAHGEVSVDDIRPLSIDDLLSRPPVPPDVDRMRSQIAGKVVLVTGAGGSIGRELVRQVASLQPSQLLLVEASEYALYKIYHEMTDAGPTDVQFVPLLGSVTDPARIDAIFAKWKPAQVYHAAAYKHVPIVEHNIVDGVRNNVLGTVVVAQAAIAHGAGNFVLVSTDKAVRPTNTMGASKRFAEMVVQALASRTHEPCFSMVRFGNVLGSSGSVVPLFRKQIREGGPVTVTDLEMTRYFMTIPEAAQLVVQAGSMAQGGEVFVLDMGDPVRISDLASKMIELSGLSVRSDAKPDGDIAITEIGLRPGEKLYEELLIGNDPSPTAHPRIMKASEAFPEWHEMSGHLDRLADLCANQDIAGIRALLLSLIPEFVPTSGLVDWLAPKDALQEADV